MGDVREMLLGRRIWYRCGYCDVNEGIAESLVGTDHVRVRCVGVEGPLQERRLVGRDDIFLTKEDLLGANYEGWKARLNAYEETIATVEDLVRFCFDHPVGKSGSMDGMARLAARRRAKDLLGIEVDPEAAAEEAVILKAMEGEG